MNGPARVGRATVSVVVAVTLALSAALLVIGVVLERGAEATESGRHNEAAERGDEGEYAETVLGVAVESPLLIGAFVLVSLLLAALVWRRPTRLVTSVVIVFAGSAAALDIAEAVRQLAAERVGLTVIAALVAALHLAVVLGAARLWTASRPTPAGT